MQIRLLGWLPVLALCGISCAQVAPPDTKPGAILKNWLAALGTGDKAKIETFHKELGWTPNYSGVASVDFGLVQAQGAPELMGLARNEASFVSGQVRFRKTGNWGVLVVSTPESGPPRLGFRNSLRPDAFAPARSLSEEQLAAKAGAFVDELTKSGAFSGAVLVLGPKGRTVFQRAAGKASIAYDVPNKVDTKFNLASMGKMLTATAIGQLVEAGKLKWDTKVGEILPDYPNADVRDKVTVHMLLTHTSGLGDIFDGDYMKLSKDLLKTVPDYLERYAANSKLIYEPGKGSRYSNYGYVLLGAIVEKVSGTPYWDYLQKNIYDRAGMKNSGAFELDYETPNLAMGYFKDEQGRWKNNLFMHVAKGSPAGGSYSTVGDMARFGQALVDGTLVSKSTLAKLTTPYSGNPEGYAYGFDVRTIGGQKTFGHSGGFPGINGEMIVFPESGHVVVVLANIDDASDPVVTRLAELVGQELKR